MKNTKTKSLRGKLSLNKETLIRLNEEKLSRAGGGYFTPPPHVLCPTKGFLWCDLSVAGACY